MTDVLIASLYLEIYLELEFEPEKLVQYFICLLYNAENFLWVLNKNAQLSTDYFHYLNFSFAIKECYSGLGKDDPTSAENKKVQMLESFCRVPAFDEIITKDTGLLHDN